MRGPILIVTACALAVPLAASWAAAPAVMQVQVVDERGMPVRDAVVELAPSGGWRGGVIRFGWKPAMAQKNVAFVPGTLVVAKGTEDTTFYRFTRFAALNEVGGSPDVWGVDVEGLHALAASREAVRRTQVPRS